VSRLALQTRARMRRWRHCLTALSITRWSGQTRSHSHGWLNCHVDVPWRLHHLLQSKPTR